ncbi:MAG TPA: MFS transporter [Thiolinea sp.]|nr:MFS transporter [Thiolinea sp.]
MQRPMPGLTEFIVIIALLSSFVALSIDAMLPALPEIGQALGVTDENQPQLILSVLFLGMALGQLVIGPLSDSMGRKPLIYIGLTIFIIGCILSWQAENFTTMLVGRFLQGLGAASPRTITMALVRDCYSGRSMARIMSFSMLVFIMVPALAPGIGQVIIHLAGWRSIFLVFILLGILVVAWFGLRIPETLPPEKRTPLRLKRQLAAIRQVLTHRYTMGYTFSTGMIFGAFLGYLNSA